MNETDLRDCFAMFALIGLPSSENMDEQARRCYEMADAMLEARKEDDGEELGIAAVKPKRKYLRRNSR
jgi:hypothetical protein